jgi:hypothetical protein
MFLRFAFHLVAFRISSSPHALNSSIRIYWTLRFYALLISSRTVQTENLPYATFSHPTVPIGRLYCPSLHLVPHSAVFQEISVEFSHHSRV